MSDDERRNGWILLLAIVLGTAVGAWLAFWVASVAAGTSRGSEPASALEGDLAGIDCSGGEPAVEVLQVLQAYAPEPPFSLPLVAGGLEAADYPRILLVALPSFGSRQRAFLFIRPDDPDLCRSLHGVALATYWQGPEPTTICAVGDPPDGETPAAAVEFFLGRSS